MSVFPTRACGCHDPDSRPHPILAHHCQNSHLEQGRCRPLLSIASTDFSALLSRGWQPQVSAGQLTISSMLLKCVMAAITKHTILRMLATTEINGL